MDAVKPSQQTKRALTTKQYFYGNQGIIISRNLFSQALIKNSLTKVGRLDSLTAVTTRTNLDKTTAAGQRYGIRRSRLFTGLQAIV